MNDALKAKPVMLVVVLGAVCAVAAVVLGLVYGATKPRIEAEEVKAKEQALRDVHPGAMRFEQITTEHAVDGTPFVYYEAYNADNVLVGYAFEGHANGYSSTIELTVGLDKDEQTITGIKITKQQETPGLGANCVKSGGSKYIWEIFSRAEAAGEDTGFQSQFSNLAVNALGDDGIPSNVRALSGATITTNAVLRALRTAISDYQVASGRDSKMTVSGATQKDHVDGPGDGQ
ncbi:MAG: FMN-binding protein [Verrucomicrobia bacterium]|nr:FMN-binding protein [Verrucomicrobiota bacterium]